MVLLGEVDDEGVEVNTEGLVPLVKALPVVENLVGKNLLGE